MTDGVDRVVERKMAQTPALSYGYARRFGVLIEPAGDVSPAADHGVWIVRHCKPLPVSVLAELGRKLPDGFTLDWLQTDEFERRLARAYEGGSSVAQTMVDDLGDGGLDALANTLNTPIDLLEADDEAPIIRLINALLSEAVREGASDIHLESFESRMVVRFRVDGMLREVLEPPRAVAGIIVSRIKVMANLDIAEKRVPQDGRISLRLAGRPVDVRVSTLPSGQGERVVLRLLDKEAGRLTLDNLGLTRELQERLNKLIHRPHGILLVTGPTGSGKTTTLYAALSEINTRERNILTVEDPIEYYLDGVGQTQVNPKVEMTFARGLRAILRQDPDVVMVGEIRDVETAEIAVQASLTGHLVLSTLHTNSAVGAITRLRDMGVEPFLLSSSLIGVLAQRLVRRLDARYREAYTPDASECALLGLNASQPPTLYRVREESRQRGQGYLGRTGVYELITIDADTRRLIHDGAAEPAIEAQVRKHSSSILAYGAALVMAGVTTTEELLRVTAEG
ncbi:MAG: type II secretion system protein GspE [Halothiobacillus sp. 14-56-357]|uniref:type II secretion system ATPase GspE n=1 Tax=Halothiobacillus sp. 15-55-196 TaxID=1970382 RepID=UPI000BD619EE|nr:type II secretion system ATPase GspE [Halothiobacillus sp. 15-55-196]OZB36692.1 MAG: type II secretion system protein GspE [Halothiobacillus sp. 15-55-196]OZB57400.1 MAG: type II secretion system protein GspE [Halothiobacillus sp. 14-56-357]OZB79499.1 MAG: type II secretion system protein GspE [Halothiobacillus sp. 13-55-115]